MVENMRRAELVSIVRQIRDATSELTEHEVDELVARFESAVPHPEASGLIFYWDEHFDDRPTAEEIVHRALAYRSIELGP